MIRQKGTAKLRKNVRFTETREGLRIDLIDEADFAMFATGTDRLPPEARALIGEVAVVLQDHAERPDRAWSHRWPALCVGQDHEQLDAVVHPRRSDTQGAGGKRHRQ